MTDRIDWKRTLKTMVLGTLAFEMNYYALHVMPDDTPLKWALSVLVGGLSWGLMAYTFGSGLVAYYEQR